MAFGKRKSGANSGEAPTSEESAEAQAPAVHDDDVDVDGPFDIEDFDDAEVALVGRHDLGAVLIPENEAAELAVEVNQQGVPTMAWMVTANGRYNVTAYAAPKAGSLWREVVTEVGKEYPDVELTHMYVDSAAMQLVRAPKQFDVIVTGNMFGDILSDQASMLTGSIGMLPSASLDAHSKGLYEPIHGSAPDIAGKDVANPLATILSLAMMMRYTFNQGQIADRIERAVKQVLAQGVRTADIYEAGCRRVGTREMGEAVVAVLAHR